VCYPHPVGSARRYCAVKRRDFITILGGAAVVWPLVAQSQPQARVPRIGLLGLGTASAWAPRLESLRAGLRDLGYIEGKTIIIEFRWADRIEQLREHAAALVEMQVDLIFAMTSTETEAARAATTTILIVFSNHADPVGLGHVASLTRPGGNITGLTVLQTELTAKALEIFREALPGAARIGVLFSPTVPSHVPTLRAVEAAGQRLALQAHLQPVRTAEDFDGAFAAMARQRVDGFFASASTLTLSHRAALAELALQHRLPGLFGARDNVVAGGFMSYAPVAPDLTRRAATYIDKILKGAKPADLPVEQASQYQLVINLKTAKALGIEVPPALLARADEVIE
jgi:putative tryptophan/tyrosine transport system substrate-binding protein